MKILVVCSEAPTSQTGLGRLVNAEVSGLRERSHTVDTVFPAASRRTELRFTSVSWRKFSGYDLIHIYGPSPLISDIALLRNQELPHVYSHVAEIVWLNELVSSIYRRFHSYLARHARKVIVMTKDYAQLFNGRAHVISPPISFKPVGGPLKKNNVFTVLFVGQMRPFKGVDVFLEAAKLVPRVKFVISGRGWAEKKYMEKIRLIPNASFVDVHSQKELADLYEQAHVLAVPSINTTEAFSLVAVEAALFGCVPVGSNLIGVRENLEYLNGFTFPTRSAKALASIVRTLSESDELWSNRSEECRKNATQYANENTTDAYAARHEELFELVA